MTSRQSLLLSRVLIIGGCVGSVLVLLGMYFGYFDP